MKESAKFDATLCEYQGGLRSSSGGMEKGRHVAQSAYLNLWSLRLQVQSLEDIWQRHDGNQGIAGLPGRDAYPDIHEKIERLQDTLWQDRLSDTTQEEIAVEIVRLRTKFASVRPDIQNESRSND